MRAACGGGVGQHPAGSAARSGSDPSSAARQGERDPPRPLRGQEPPCSALAAWVLSLDPRRCPRELPFGVRPSVSLIEAGGASLSPAEGHEGRRCLLRRAGAIIRTAPLLRPRGRTPQAPGEDAQCEPATKRRPPQFPPAGGGGARPPGTQGMLWTRGAGAADQNSGHGAAGAQTVGGPRDIIRPPRFPTAPAPPAFWPRNGLGPGLRGGLHRRADTGPRARCRAHRGSSR